MKKDLTADGRGVVIGIANQKGGVGKTTTAVNVAHGLALRGYRTLLIDADAQANATSHLGIKPGAYEGTLSLLVNPDADLTQLVLSEDPESQIRLPKNLDLLPSQIQLEKAEQMLLSSSDSRFFNRTDVFRSMFDTAREHYDFTVVDTPPTPGVLTSVATYAATDWLLLTTTPERFSIEGVATAARDVSACRKQGRNPDLEILGLLLCRVDRRTKRWEEIYADIARHVPGREFVTVISMNNAVVTSADKSKTLFQVNLKHKDCAPIEQYQAVVAQIIERVKNREAFLGGNLKTKVKRPLTTKKEREEARTVAPETEKVVAFPEAPAPEPVATKPSVNE